MDFPLTNNYIQYLTKNGIVKTFDVHFVKGFYESTFTVSGINEDFFILSVFENGIKKTGLTFQNVENVDMLAFINSNFFDVNLVPQNAFFSSEFIVILKYNHEYSRGSSSFVNSLHPDHSFFNFYCERNFPYKKFHIEPIFHGWSVNSQLFNPDSNLLYFVKVPVGANIIVATVSKTSFLGVESQLNEFYYSAFNAYQFSMFNKCLSSTGSNYAGITAVTSANAYVPMVGYVAVFDEPIFL